VQRLLGEGRRALNDGSVHQLSSVNARLRNHLPDEAGVDLDDQMSTVRRGDGR
jgi:hypothetical protein